jgi:hypothetical protein
MFVQHKQLKFLNVPATKVSRLNTSAYSIQLALPDFKPQMAAAYLVALAGGSKVLVVVGLHLSESKASVFFVPRQGEVPVEDAERVFEEGFVFAESMGFVLNETDYHLMSNQDQQKLWDAMPISKLSAPASDAAATAKQSSQGGAKDDLDSYRQRSLESLGRFLSSL